MSVSVVVPCYRSAATLPDLVERIRAAMSGSATAYEVILVVDGSPDETATVARRLASLHGTVSAIELARNYGQHNALVAGIRAARHDVIVTMDDDLQHPPEEIGILLDALGEDVDLVYAVPLAEEHGVLRSLLSRWVKAAIAGGAGVRNAREIGAFRAFRAFLRDGFATIPGPHVCLDVALSWGTTRVATVRVRMDTRASGRSGYTFRTLLRHTVTMVVGYSALPLRAVSYLGLIVGMFGVALCGKVLWSYFAGDTTIAGFTTLAAMVAIFSAAQMVSVGVLGEYVGRIHASGLGRPPYVVRQTTLIPNHVVRQPTPADAEVEVTVHPPFPVRPRP